MAKDVTLTDVAELTGVIRFNQPDIETEGDYWAVVVLFSCAGVGEGARKNVREEIKVGKKTGMHTPKELYTVVAGISQGLANKLKDLYQEAINVDVSQ